jgi:hypothetical protein
MSEAAAQSRELVEKLQAIKAPLMDQRMALAAELETACDGPRAQEAAVREKIKALMPKLCAVDELLSSADGVKFIKDGDIRKQVVDKITAKMGAK